MKRKRKTVSSVTLERGLGLLLFLIIVAFLNLIWINNSVYTTIVTFLNQYLMLIIIMSILFYFGEIFWIMDFPLNLASPPFNAFGAVALVGFVFNIFTLVEKIVGDNIFYFLRVFEYGISLIVFLIVIILGYLIILTESSILSGSKREKYSKRRENLKEENIEWEDIKNEFRLIFYNIGRNIAIAFEPKNERKNNLKKRKNVSKKRR